jgi:hypothetical protein
MTAVRIGQRLACWKFQRPDLLKLDFVNSIVCVSTGFGILDDRVRIPAPLIVDFLLVGFGPNFLSTSIPTEATKSESAEEGQVCPSSSFYSCLKLSEKY